MLVLDTRRHLRAPSDISGRSFIFHGIFRGVFLCGAPSRFRLVAAPPSIPPLILFLLTAKGGGMSSVLVLVVLSSMWALDFLSSGPSGPPLVGVQLFLMCDIGDRVLSKFKTILSFKCSSSPSPLEQPSPPCHFLLAAFSSARAFCFLYHSGTLPAFFSSS